MELGNIQELTKTMDQSPAWEANSYSADQEIPRRLRNPKIHYRVHKSPHQPTVPILSQMHPLHIFPLYFPKIHFNIILPSMPTSSEWSLPFRFLTKILYTFLFKNDRVTLWRCSKNSTVTALTGPAQVSKALNYGWRTDVGELSQQSVQVGREKLSLGVTKHHAMKKHGGVDVKLHTFLTSALDGGECSASRPSRFNKVKVPPVPIV
jgi:hypothetical protein